MSDPVKITYLIKRREGVSRDELAVHWFANHLPGVIANMRSARDRGREHPKKYIATLFSGSDPSPGEWDGMANLWWDNPLPEPKATFGEPPGDSFQEKAEPFRSWATREFVIIDGELPLEPLTLSDPFPCTRSGFTKLSVLVRAKPGVDFEKMFTHWIDVHAPNVSESITEYGCFRYVLSLSLKPETEAFAGLGELYFDNDHGLESWENFRNRGNVKPDGMEVYVEDGTQIFVSDTEMIGIP